MKKQMSSKLGTSNPQRWIIDGVLAVLLIVSVVFAFTLNSKVSTLQEETQSLSTELQNTKNELETVQRDLADVEAEKDEIQQEFDDQTNLVKEYNAKANVVNQDSVVFGQKIEEFDETNIGLTEERKVLLQDIIDLDTIMQAHISDFNEVLVTNRDALEELGFQVDREIESLRDWEEVVDNVMVYLEENRDLLT